MILILFPSLALTTVHLIDCHTRWDESERCNALFQITVRRLVKPIDYPWSMRYIELSYGTRDHYSVSAASDFALQHP